MQPGICAAVLVRALPTQQAGTQSGQQDMSANGGLTLSSLPES